MIRALALAMVLAACGRELHHTVDAPPTDTVEMHDIGDNGEPPVEAVTLTITRLGAPVGGADVIFQRADGSLITTGVTDINGRAWAAMPDGGMVTAIEHMGPDLDELTTFATVGSGDDLRLDSTPTASGTSGTANVTVSTDSLSSAYSIQTSCGNGGADVSGVGVINLVNCGPVIDLVVLGLDGDGLPNGSALYAANLPLASSIGIAGTYSPLESIGLDYTNVPVQTASVLATQTISAVRPAYQAANSGTPAGSVHIDLQRPQTSGTVLTATTLYPQAGLGEVGQQIVYAWDGAATASKTFDLSQFLLPMYATAPAYDVGTHAVTWTERASGVAPDAMVTKLQIYRDDIPTGHAWRWQLAGARTATTITFPTLPVTGGFDYTPTATDSVGVSELIGMRLPGGLAPWRASIFAPTSQVFATTAGSLTVQTLYEEQL